MAILINLPDYRHLRGGVASFYTGLREHWSKRMIYNIVGKRHKRLPGLLWLPSDCLRFVFRIFRYHPEGILLNPSFNKSAWERDKIFLRIARMLGIPVAVMFHGWNEEYVDSISPEVLQKNFRGAKVIMVLAGRFASQLRDMGVEVPVEFFTTHVSDKLLSQCQALPRKALPRQFLFLSRIERAKGIYETLELFKLIKEECPDAVLTVAGDGSELSSAKKYVSDRSIEGVVFAGFVEGCDKASLLSKSDFFIFPSYYKEGLPGALIEAMAFGLPVLTRPVGGIPDFFKDGKMGILCESLEPVEMMEAIRPYLYDLELNERTSEYNMKYAEENFRASKVARVIEGILQQVFRPD